MNLFKRKVKAPMACEVVSVREGVTRTRVQAIGETGCMLTMFVSRCKVKVGKSLRKGATVGLL